MFVADHHEAHDREKQPQHTSRHVVGAHSEPYGQTYQPVGAHAAQENRAPRQRYLRLRNIAGRFPPHFRRQHAGQNHHKIGEEERPCEIPHPHERPVARYFAPAVPAGERPRHQYGVVAREQLGSGEYHQYKPQREYRARQQALESGRFGRSGEPESRHQREQAAYGDVCAGQKCEYEGLAGRILQFVRRGASGQREDLFGGIDSGHKIRVEAAKVKNPPETAKKRGVLPGNRFFRLFLRRLKTHAPPPGRGRRLSPGCKQARFLPTPRREIFFRPSDRRKRGKNGVPVRKSCAPASDLSP